MVGNREKELAVFYQGKIFIVNQYITRVRFKNTSLILRLGFYPRLSLQPQNQAKIVDRDPAEG